MITEAKHLLRANPTILAVEEAVQKDPDYKMMIDFIRANKNFKDLPPHSEGFRIGGKWPNLEILPENSSVSKAYRPIILEALQKSWRKSYSVFLRERH